MALVLWAPRVHAQEGASRPNVLFVMSDDLNRDLGTYGHPIVHSPNIDRLAERGVRFDRAYNQYPWCGPSRASLLTGLRPDSVRVYDLIEHFRSNVPDIVTLPQLFRNAGYFTARVGKIYHYHVPRGMGTNGLDDPASWDVALNPVGRDYTNPSEMEVYGGMDLTGLDVEHTDGMVATMAIELMEDAVRRGQPFFIGVGFYRPHTPFYAPKRYFDLYDPESFDIPTEFDLRDVPAPAATGAGSVVRLSEEEVASRRHYMHGYFAGISFMDAQFGRVLDAVERLGIADNTVIVFLSDHVYLLGEYNMTGKQNLFDRVSGAPLIIAGPGVAHGKASDAVVEYLDLYRTLADLAGLEAPDYVQGRSLRPVLEDPARDWPYPAYTQVFRTVRGVEVDGRSVHTDRWRYTEWDGGEWGRELYDLIADPTEQTNLASDPRYEATVAELSELLRRGNVAAHR